VEKGGNGFLPISLQYSEYTAEYARDPSIGGDAREKDVLNHTYKGKTVTPNNSTDLTLVLDTKKAMKEKPVIVVLNMSNPTVVAEFEKEINALLVDFGVQNQAILDILVGNVEPSGLLPLQMPTNMKTVEAQFEDVPHDMECHVDSEGNTYDSAFGLNYSGVINGGRIAKYKK